MPPKTLTIMLSLAALVGACATPETDQQYVSLEEDPRVGERESQLCFRRSITGFSEYQNGEGLILRRGRDHYLVTFAGPCFAARNALAIGFDRRFSSAGCLARGDRIFMTDSLTGQASDIPFRSDTCVIRDIYAFDPGAEPADRPSAEQE